MQEKFVDCNIASLALMYVVFNDQLHIVFCMIPGNSMVNNLISYYITSKFKFFSHF